MRGTRTGYGAVAALGFAVMSLAGPRFAFAGEETASKAAAAPKATRTGTVISVPGPRQAASFRHGAASPPARVSIPRTVGESDSASHGNRLVVPRNARRPERERTERFFGLESRDGVGKGSGTACDARSGVVFRDTGEGGVYVVKKGGHRGPHRGVGIHRSERRESPLRHIGGLHREHQLDFARASGISLGVRERAGRSHGVSPHRAVKPHAHRQRGIVKRPCR